MEEIRVQIESLLEAEKFVVFDFKGVEIFSHSFSDECFAKLLLKLPFPVLKPKKALIFSY